MALINGFKIYNHARYTFFIKEILQKSDLAEDFDGLRKVRNDINYYGKSLSLVEAEYILKSLDELLVELKKIS